MVVRGILGRQRREYRTPEPHPSGAHAPKLPGELIPKHVAIVMDGNGRWAKERGLPRTEGHKVGAERILDVLQGAVEMGVGSISLYAFSTENWARPLREVDGLMALLRRYLASELGKMMQHQIRLRAVGSLRRLPPAVREALRATVEATKRNTGMTVMLAVSYGGREEIARAARAIARRVERGELDPGRITARTVAKHLGTAGIPDPDLLIRTGGEMRISNFFLWQLAYTEIYVSKSMWPEFREREYLQALGFFQQRQRRYGRVPAQLERERLRVAY